MRPLGRLCSRNSFTSPERLSRAPPWITRSEFNSHTPAGLHQGSGGAGSLDLAQRVDRARRGLGRVRGRRVAHRQGTRRGIGGRAADQRCGRDHGDHSDVPAPACEVPHGYRSWSGTAERMAGARRHGSPDTAARGTRPVMRTCRRRPGCTHRPPVTPTRERETATTRGADVCAWRTCGPSAEPDRAPAGRSDTAEQLHGGDHAEPLAIADHRWSAASTTFRHPTRRMTLARGNPPVENTGRAPRVDLTGCLWSVGQLRQLWRGWKPRTEAQLSDGPTKAQGPGRAGPAQSVKL